MPNTLSFSGLEPVGADGTETCEAPALLALTGASPLPLGATNQFRFATALAPSGAGTVCDVNMVGGLDNPRSWQLVTYTASGGALSAAATLVLSDVAPAGSSGSVIGQAPALLALTGGVQGTYAAGAPWYRFATSYSPANGQTVADLVMLGGKNNSERWQVVVYTVTGGVLS